MFLWLTSPTGHNGLVLSTEPFFDLELPTRALVADANLSLRTEKLDSTRPATKNALVWGDDNLVYFALHTNDVWALLTSTASRRRFRRRRRSSTTIYT